MKSNLILLWASIPIFAMFIVLKQYKEGKHITSREMIFLLFGLFLGGFPLFINTL
jgi:hypothetical protein